MMNMMNVLAAQTENTCYVLQWKLPSAESRCRLCVNTAVPCSDYVFPLSASTTDCTQQPEGVWGMVQPLPHLLGRTCLTHHGLQGHLPAYVWCVSPCTQLYTHLNLRSAQNHLHGRLHQILIVWVLITLKPVLFYRNNILRKGLLSGATFVSFGGCEFESQGCPSP